MSEKDSTWKLYACVRQDLNMNKGKLASQAGHAFLESFLAAGATRQSAYHADGLGTKICLAIRNEMQLHLLYEQAKEAGLPCTLIEDSGRNTCFNGVPTCTAVGIGPILAVEAPFLRKFKLYTQ